MEEKIDKRNYSEILENIKKCFTSPVENPVMDGYLVHTISHFLDNIDNLKCVAPVLGIDLESCMEFTLHKVDKEMLPKRMDKKRQHGDQSGVQHFPDNMKSVEEVTELLTEYCKNMVIWSHPYTQINVIPPPTIPSIIATMATSILNPNMMWDEYSGNFTDAEIHTVAILSDLVGYDQKQSGGIFTFGGTGANLYGCKLGIEKMFNGRVMIDGIREDIKIVASESSHYSKLNIAGWLGIGTKNVVTIPTKENTISLKDLENYLQQAFSNGEKVAVILATMGTTDAFGIDDLEAIVQLRDKFAVEYELEHPPFIHADAVIGWPWIVFKDYDFDENPLGFHTRTKYALQDSIEKIKNLHMADSLAIDFHKTGYAPYVSSVFVVKDRRDLTLISRIPEQIPYAYQFGNYHPGIYTLETSRSGSGCMAALANIRLFGKQGYRVLIGHIVEMAEMLRDKLEKYPFIKILNSHNYGPVTLFRLYPDDVDVTEALQRELTDPDYRQQLEKNNSYNLHIFKQTYERAMQGKGVLLSWTDVYRHADYLDGLPIAAMKSFIMSPWTDLDAVEMVVRQVIEARNLKYK